MAKKRGKIKKINYYDVEISIAVSGSDVMACIRGRIENVRGTNVVFVMDCIYQDKLKSNAPPAAVHLILKRVFFTVCTTLLA